MMKPKKGYKTVRLFPRYDDETIPDDWKSNRVDSVLKIIDYRGRTPPFSEEGIPHLRSNNIRDGKINFDEITFVTKKTYDEYMTRGIPKENDVLFTTEGPLGETAIVPKNFIFSLAQRIIVLRPKTSEIDSKFLKYILDEYILKKRYKGLSTGTTLGGISSKWFNRFILTYPSTIKEQQKIASILSNVDDLINCTQKTVEQTKNVKKGLIQKLLTKGIEHNKFKKVKGMFGKEIEIPKEWEATELQNHAELYVPMRDKPKKFDGDIPWLRIEDLDDKYANDSKSNQRVSKQTVKEMKLRVYPIGTVLCSCSATIGVCAITTKELTTNQTFIGITPNSSLDNEFLYYFLTTQKNYLNTVGSGSTILYISRKKFEKMKIFLPSIDEQQKIASILANVDSQIQTQTQYKEKLERLKKSLMQKLLTGEIRVKVLCS